MVPQKKETYEQSVTLEQLFNEWDRILGRDGWHKIRAGENGVKRWCLLPRDKQDTEKKKSWMYLNSCRKSSCQAVFAVRAGKVSVCVGVHEWDESFSEIESREQQNQRSPWMYSSRLTWFSDVSKGMSSYSRFSGSTDKITLLNPGTYFPKTYEHLMSFNALTNRLKLGNRSNSCQGEMVATQW